MIKLTKPFHWRMYKLFCYNEGIAEGDYKSVVKWRKIC